jgi:26S proteasome regulatory subunit N1
MAPKDKDATELAAQVDKKKDNGSTKKKNGKKTQEELAEEALSEEDRELKERLETCISTLINKENEAAVTVPLRLQSLDVIVTELRTSTSSMTSVPKPLKFLRPHFSVLKKFYNIIAKEADKADDDGLELRARLADVLAVLAMTMGKPEDRESLKFKLAGAKDYDMLAARGAEPKTPLAGDNLGSWGHEFVRSLAGEIGQEYTARILDGAEPHDDQVFDDILKMVDVIVPFHVTHNAEAEAVDLLIEVQRLKNLLKLDAIDENNFSRICLYLVKTADYMADPDDLVVRCCYYVVLADGALCCLCVA